MFDGTSLPSVPSEDSYEIPKATQKIAAESGKHLQLVYITKQMIE